MQKRWSELTAAQKQKIWDRSDRIYWAFDAFGGDGETDKKLLTIKEAVLQVNDEEYGNLLNRIEGDKAEDDLFSLFEGIFCPAFAFGYIFGQMFDLAHPILQRDVESLKKKLQEHGAFAYLPRKGGLIGQKGGNDHEGKKI